MVFLRAIVMIFLVLLAPLCSPAAAAPRRSSSSGSSGSGHEAGASALPRVPSTSSVRSASGSDSGKPKRLDNRGYAVRHAPPPPPSGGGAALTRDQRSGSSGSIHSVGFSAAAHGAPASSSAKATEDRPASVHPATKLPVPLAAAAMAAAASAPVPLSAAPAPTTPKRLPASAAPAPVAAELTPNIDFSRSSLGSDSDLHSSGGVPVAMVTPVKAPAADPESRILALSPATPVGGGAAGGVVVYESPYEVNASGGELIPAKTPNSHMLSPLSPFASPPPASPGVSPIRASGQKTSLMTDTSTGTGKKERRGRRDATEAAAAAEEVVSIIKAARATAVIGSPARTPQKGGGALARTPSKPTVGDYILAEAMQMRAKALAAAPAEAAAAVMASTVAKDAADPARAEATASTQAEGTSAMPPLPPVAASTDLLVAEPVAPLLPPVPARRQARSPNRSAAPAVRSLSSAGRDSFVPAGASVPQAPAGAHQPKERKGLLVASGASAGGPSSVLSADGSAIAPGVTEEVAPASTPADTYAANLTRFDASVARQAEVLTNDGMAAYVAKLPSDLKKEYDAFAVTHSDNVSRYQEIIRLLLERSNEIAALSDRIGVVSGDDVMRKVLSPDRRASKKDSPPVTKRATAAPAAVAAPTHGATAKNLDAALKAAADQATNMAAPSPAPAPSPRAPGLQPPVAPSMAAASASLPSSAQLTGNGTKDINDVQNFEMPRATLGSLAAAGFILSASKWVQQCQQDFKTDRTYLEESFPRYLVKRLMELKPRNRADYLKFVAMVSAVGALGFLFWPVSAS